MRRDSDKRAARLVEDGNGYRTPLTDGDTYEAMLQRDVAGLPRRPRYAQQRCRKLHEPRPAPPQHPEKSMVLTSIQGILISLLAGVLVFSLLAGCGRWISPDLPMMENGIAPFGPRVLITFALYAITGCVAGCGVGYWMLRSVQH